MIFEDLRADLLDAHHVYRSPEILYVVAEPLTNNSQFLLESLHACDHVGIANLRRSEQLFQQLYVSQRVTIIILVTQSPPGVKKTHLGLTVAHNFKPLVYSSMRENESPWSCMLRFDMSTHFSFAAARSMSDSEIS